MRTPLPARWWLALGALALLAGVADAGPARMGDDACEAADCDEADADDDFAAADPDDDLRSRGRGGSTPPWPGTAASARVVGPPIADVLQRAYRAAGLDRSSTSSWIRRSRASGLIPWVTVRTGRNTRWQDLDPGVDRGVTIEVRAMWRLDRLLFDAREVQAASIEAARLRERRRLASRVIRAYFHWRRVAAAAASQPRWASRAEEAAAELDALTDGWFSSELGNRRPRRASQGPRP